jgi:thimet oligopeptidase
MNVSKLSLAVSAAVAVAVGACAHVSTVPVHHPVAQEKAVDVPGLPFHVTPEALSEACQQAQAHADAQIAALLAVPAARRTFVNTFTAYDALQAEFLQTALELGFLKDIHPDEKVRQAAVACEVASNAYLVQLGARKDVYQALLGYAEGAGKMDALAPVDHQLMTLTLRELRRNGLALPDADRAHLVELRSKLTALGTKFESNLDENQDAFEATAQELEGLPASFLARLNKAKDGKYVVTTKYPDYFPVMELAKSEATRKRAFFVFNSRAAKQNLPLLQEAVAERDEAARLLGYATHADFVTETRMAKDAHTVSQFLERLRDELKPGRDALNAQMLALKVKETHNAKARLESWDTSYYLGQIKKAGFAVDDEEVRGYFPADKVVAGMFEVYQRLLHVTFKEVAGADVWFPGVKLYAVHDAADGRLLAKFYIDLFPRPGKYGHAASFPLSPGREVAAGYQIPLTALVTNFEPPQAGRASHLSEKEVTTLFHEFGHVMHECLTTSPYATLAGTSVSLDFVEAPSQMLENWVYAPEVLALISEDPKNPGHPMPEALAKKLAAARTFDAGYVFSRQVVLALLDFTLHTSGPKVDADGIQHRLWHEVMGYPVYPDEHMPASFGHLMGGYDAGYYGYLWSKVFAQDMFTRFEKEGVLSPKTGLDYREEILASGRTVEADELLRRFLGRAPDDKAFLRLLGVGASAAP